MTAARRINIDANIPWSARKSAATKRWIGVCDALNLSMEADSLDELHQVIPEAIALLFLDLFEDNELDAFLLERGWRAEAVPLHRQDGVEFNVPWHLIAEGANDTERRAH